MFQETPKQPPPIRGSIFSRNRNIQKTQKPQSSQENTPQEELPPPSLPASSSESPVANPFVLPPTTVSDDESEELLDSDEQTDDDSEEDDEIIERDIATFISERSIENRTKEVTFKIDLTLPRFGVLFWIQVVKVALMVTVIIIAYLVASGIAAINNFLYLIFGSVLTLFICGFDVLYLSTYSSRNSNLAYDHLGTLWWSAIFTILTMIVSWFELGRWLLVYASCCDFDDSQPIPGNLVNFIRFIGSYTVMLVFPAVNLVVFTPRVFTAIMYPLTTAPSRRKKIK